MNHKNCTFKFDIVSETEVKNMLLSCKNKPPGDDNLDGKFPHMVAELIAPVI